MPTRRDFLQSALLLPAALTLPVKANAQDDKPATVTFADFESGNYDGWTIEGDAFGTAPATDALFPGKIRGFTGRGLLCSLHQRKGNAATGKAISKEFTIAKPFLTFKIGGGDPPHRESGDQACLNLIVDNQIVRTATGDGTANLSESSFDVSNLLGRKAHIEIVDATASTDRGYIMLDDIQFTDQHPDERPDRRHPYTNYLRPNTLRFHNLPLAVQSRYDAAVQKIYFQLDTPPMRHHPGERFDDIVKRLCVLSSDAAQFAGATDALTKQLLTAEVIAGWVRHNLRYNLRPQEQRKNGNEPDYILREQQPQCDCSGFTALTVKLSKALGLTCEHLGVQAAHTERRFMTWVKTHVQNGDATNFPSFNATASTLSSPPPTNMAATTPPSRGFSGYNWRGGFCHGTT